MKKILMYTNDKIYTTSRMTGGIKRFKLLYEGLKKEGYNVTLYCGENEQELKKYNSSAISVNREIEKSFIFPSISIFLKNRKKYQSIKKENFDDVIVFDVPTATGLCISRIKEINLFLRQDLIEYRKIQLKEKKKSKLYSFFYLKLMNFCESICCRRAKKIILQCRYDFNNLIERHKFIKKNISSKSFIQINNTNAPWIVEKSKEKTRLNKRKVNEFCIAFIGDFSSTRKGHDIFLDSIKRMTDEKYNVRAYVVGDGELLNKTIKQYEDYHNIEFLGRLANPICVVKQSNLVVVPSRADSCPNTILESLYNGVLVIGTNAGGIPEILSSADMLFDVDSESLYKKIKALYDDNKMCDSLLKKEVERNKELCFDWVKKIVFILEENND